MSTRNNLALHLPWLQREKPFIPPPLKEPRPSNAALPPVAIPRASAPSLSPPPPPPPPPQTAPPTNPPATSFSIPSWKPVQSLPPSRLPPQSANREEEDPDAEEMVGALKLSSSVRAKRPKLGSLPLDSHPNFERSIPTSNTAKPVPRTPAVGSLSREESRTGLHTGMGFCTVVSRLRTLLMFHPSNRIDDACSNRWKLTTRCVYYYYQTSAVRYYANRHDRPHG